MEILNQALEAYLENHTDAESELLKKINRETYSKILRPHMLSGHYQGRVLSMLSKLVQPERILEIGTFTGYATLCLAEGLKPGGIVHTIDNNPELEDMQRNNFSESSFSDSIQLHIGHALEIIPTLDETFDLVFIDADKKNNYTYFELVLHKVRPGGLILVDNVLWKGKVFAEDKDSDTVTIRKFNDHITADERVEKMILPMRDGLMLIRKK
jgi:caffeoyl-CoA O-methyltransferase